ncbi:hypothetical protein [Spirosoma flavum]|uniref:Uncharacterized protein n=1 Tax=Spirosoma flavum TaxID=2048557 RepID=A0ABW6AED0_9BACT
MLTPSKRFFLLVVMLLPTVGHLNAQPTADVRNVRWGFTPKQVKEAERAKPSSTKKDKVIYTQVPLVDRKVGLEYDFNGDSLLSASYYYYTTASITKDDVLAASVDFEALLTEKYGPGKASFLGDIRNVVWLTPRTQISFSVGNVDKGWSLEVVYLCRVCSGQATKIEQSKTSWKPHKDIKDF